MLVRNGTQEGFYDVLIDVKVEKTITNLRQESVFVLDDDVTIDAEDIASYVFDEHLETLRFGGNIVGLGRMHLYFGVPYASVYFDEAVASIEYLHFNLDFSVSGSTGFHNRLDLYFAGDCPEMGSGTLYNDNFAGMMIHYHEGASGFSTFMQTASTTCIEDEAFIPDVTIHEYVLATNRKGREIAKSIYERSVEAGNDEFLLFPISGLEFYFDLKEFTLGLTKDCASKYEKARVILEWIYENIEYDLEYETASVEEVFNDRKGVCAGYSFLYHDMLAAVGVPSFFTGGALISEIPQDDTETFVRASFDSSQYSAPHGWLYLIIDGEPVCCDPTWGQFDLSDESLSQSRIIFHIDGIQVMYDDRLYPLIRDSAVLFYEGEYYCVRDGVATVAGEVSFSINYVLMLTFEVNRDSKVTHGAESFDSPLVIPYGAVYHDGLLYYEDPDFLLQSSLTLWRYCMSDGKTIPFQQLLRYMNEEQKRYGTTFQKQFDLGFCFLHEGMFYLEYKPNELMLFASIDTASSITVPSSVNGKKVTSLGAGCFEKMDALEEIILPEGLKSMVGGCFSRCSSLKSVTVPSTVTEFGSCMFDFCYSLTEVYLPEGMTTIPNGTFDFCKSLEHIDIPSAVTRIETLAFGNCTVLKDVTLPVGLEVLEEDAFSWCPALTEAYIPASVNEIDGSPYQFCRNLTSLSVDPDNPYFDSRGNCNAIIRTEANTLVAGSQSMVIPQGIVAIEEKACAGLMNIDELVIPSSVVTIGKFAFYGSEQLRRVRFEDGSALKTIEESGFDTCSILEEIILPEGVEYLGEAAFAYCKALKGLTLPSTLRYIGGYAFYAASKLTEASYRGLVEDWGKVELDPDWNNLFACQIIHCVGGDVAL